MDLLLFGNFEARVAGRPIPHLRSQKAIWALGILALRDGKPVSRDWLAKALWPELETGAALANLRPLLSDLRAALGPEAHRLVSTDRSNLLLDLRDAAVDVLRFDREIKEDETRESAVRLYRGPLLNASPNEEVARERELRETACLDALRILIGSSPPDRAVTFARRAVEIAPWHDEPQRNLMQALADLGDLNGALQAYREFARLLTRERSSVPDRQTQELYARFRADLSDSGKAPASKPLVTNPNNLPHLLDDLVGRDDERAEVAELLQEKPLVTLTGVGGIGKTRLALSVAGDLLPNYPGGVWFIPLDRLADDRSVLLAVAAAVGTRQEGLRPLVESIAAALSPLPTLIVLDNCEHVLSSCANLATHLLHAKPELRFLTTSRQPLNVGNERAWSVPPLAAPNVERLPSGRTTLLRVASAYESVQLFAERAASAQPQFELNVETVPYVAEICARLEGIPLAIELAAARVRSLAVSTLSEKLKVHQLELLQARGNADRRQSTLRATLDWSYDLLSPSERGLLQRLSVFVGGWSLEAAEKVAGDAADHLPSLIDKSLVVFEARSGRYRFLETVRQYAGEKLTASGMRPETERRFCEWCLELTRELAPQLTSKNPAPHFDRLALERSNILTALDIYATSPNPGTDGLELATGMWRYWLVRGPRSEGREKLAAALAHPTVFGDHRIYAQAQNVWGALAFHDGDRKAARPLFESSLAMRRRIGDTSTIANSLSNLANVLFGDGDFLAARQAFTECIALSRQNQMPVALAMALLNLAYLLIEQLGKFPQARTMYEEARDLFQQADDTRGVAICLEGIGFTASGQGDYDFAQDCHEQSLSLRESIGDQGTAWPKFYLAEVACYRGDLTGSRDLLLECRDLFNDQGDTEGIAATNRELGELDYLENNLAASRIHYERALALYNEMGERQSEIAAQISYCRVIHDLGDPIRAWQLITKAMSEQHRMGSVRDLNSALRTSATMLVRQGNTELSVRLRAFVHGQEAPNGAVQGIYDRNRTVQDLEKAKSILGEAGFNQAWSSGLTDNVDGIVSAVLAAPFVVGSAKRVPDDDILPGGEVGGGVEALGHRETGGVSV